MSYDVVSLSFLASYEQRFPHIAHSPFLPTRVAAGSSKAERKHSVESVVLIPALTVKAHYQSLVGPTYSNRSSVHTSPHHPSTSSSSPHHLEPPSSPLPHLPVKRGVLSLSAVIESLPEDIKLTHSFLEFIEQVARPTIAATVISSSSSSESLADDTEMTAAEDRAAVPSPSPISFPVDVTLTFHIQPSTVLLTCQPHSQVECIIQSPDVNFVISFSLFTHQPLEGSAGSSPSCSTTGPTPHIVPFNNLYITGCLTTFVLQLYSPQRSSLKPGGVENKEALSLTLGQALVHFSRKSVLAPTKPAGKPATSVDDYATHNKLQVSGMYMQACVTREIVYSGALGVKGIYSVCKKNISKCLHLKVHWCLHLCHFGLYVANVAGAL